MNPVAENVSPSEFATVKTQVENLDQKVTTLINSVNDLVTSRKPPYGLMLQFSAVAISIGTFIYTSINNRIENMNTAFMPRTQIEDKINAVHSQSNDRFATLSNAFTLADKYNDKIMDAIGKRRDDWQMAMSLRVTKLEEKFEHVVPREEHMQHWKDVENVSKKIDEMFPLHDTIATIQRRLDRAEDKNK